MLRLMATKRVIVSMPERLIEALNRATSGSPKSRSEIVCEAVERHLAERGRLDEQEPVKVSEDAFFDRVGIIFKGQGFYKTDSRGASGTDSGDGKAATSPSQAPAPAKKESTDTGSSSTSSSKTEKAST